MVLSTFDTSHGTPSWARSGTRSSATCACGDSGGRLGLIAAAIFEPGSRGAWRRTLATVAAPCGSAAGSRGPAPARPGPAAAVDARGPARSRARVMRRRCSSSPPPRKSCVSRSAPSDVARIRSICRLTGCAPRSSASQYRTNARSPGGSSAGCSSSAAVLTTLLPLLPGANGEVVTPTLPIGIGAGIWGLWAAVCDGLAPRARLGHPRGGDRPGSCARRSRPPTPAARTRRRASC